MSTLEDYQNFINKLKKLKNELPNDQELGKIIRKILNDIN
jgi:hypothetical protein